MTFSVIIISIDKSWANVLCQILKWWQTEFINLISAITGKIVMRESNFSPGLRTFELVSQTSLDIHLWIYFPLDVKKKCFYFTFVKHWRYCTIRRHDKIISGVTFSVILEVHTCKFLETIMIFHNSLFTSGTADFLSNRDEH